MTYLCLCCIGRENCLKTETEIRKISFKYSRHSLDIMKFGDVFEIFLNFFVNFITFQVTYLFTKAAKNSNIIGGFAIWLHFVSLSINVTDGMPSVNSQLYISALT